MRAENDRPQEMQSLSVGDNLEQPSEAAPDSEATPLAIPKERWKTLLALAIMMMGMLLTAISTAYVHDRVPDSLPLPDIGLELAYNVSWALRACEVLLLINMAVSLLVSLLHKHRWVVMRRVFFLIGVVFAYRAVTIGVTAMPNPNSNGSCEPKFNGSLPFLDMVKRVTSVVIGGGFSVSNSHNLCGDYIFSGHTASLTLSYMVVRHYTPPAAGLLRRASLLVSLASFILLVLSHGHYTVDLIIGYWLASRLWWILHTMAELPVNRRSCGHLAEVWWFPIFNFLEANVPGKLPCEMELPWQRGCFIRAYQRLGSFRIRLRSFMH